MSGNNATIPAIEEQAFLDVAINGGFFQLIELGMMVILMLVLAITKIVSRCKKSKSTEEKLKILQETFDLKAIEKLGVTMKQDGSKVATETLGTVVHAAAQQVANSIKESASTVMIEEPKIAKTQISEPVLFKSTNPSLVISQQVIEEIVQKSVDQLAKSQPQPVSIPLDKTGRGSVKAEIKTSQGTIPIVLNVSKEKKDIVEEVAIEMPQGDDWKNSRASSFNDQSELVEYVESDMLSVASEITEIYESDIELMRRSIEFDINNNPKSKLIKLNCKQNIEGNWDYFYQIYDSDGNELLKSSELLSVSAYRNKVYKETISEMIQQDFKGLVIQDR